MKKEWGCPRDQDPAFQIQFKWTIESAKIVHHFDLRPLAAKKTIFSYIGKLTVSTQEVRGVLGNASGNSYACLMLSDLPRA